MERIKKRLIASILLVWTVFQLWANTAGRLGAVKLRTAHILFLLPLTFLLYPASKKKHLRGECVLNAAFIAAALVSFSYLFARYDAVARTGRLNPMDVWAGVICLLAVFEAARRASGSLAAIALLFLSYFAWWGRYIPGLFGTNAFSLKRVIKALVWDTNGILGTGAGVSATYIFIFVLFGAFLKKSGFSQLINDLALTLVGRSPGGPAKVSVLASALMGMMNGSAVANVATTGSITIPLMEKTGYKKEFAAAVEAAASTGGQFTPPIMGAVGFVMAEFMGVSYQKVMLAALIPALLYYLSLLYSVHLEAKRLGLSGLSPENLPKAGKVLRERGHLLLPIAVLAVLMLMGYTPLFAAVAALAAIIPVSWLKKETRMHFKDVIEAALDGSKSAVGVGVSCIIIGVIIGSVNMTGLGLHFGELVLNVVGEGKLLLGGVMVMVMSIILGMGVPGVAAYVIVYTVAVPVLRSAGATEMAANMFCLIYACLSNITPPVAMSAYVASGIAKSNMTQTALTAMRLGAAGFILPFFFLHNPVLLCESGTFPIGAFLTSVIGVFALTAGLAGMTHLTLEKLVCRGLLIGGGLLSIHPAWQTDLAAMVLIGTAIILQNRTLKAMRKEEKGL